jgi:uncharacterized membrane protein AbrB (regulator of aidB expression)
MPVVAAPSVGVAGGLLRWLRDCVITSILLTLAVTAVAGASAARWRLPGGALMWALAAAAALHLTLGTWTQCHSPSASPPRS